MFVPSHVADKQDVVDCMVGGCSFKGFYKNGT